MRVAVTGGTGFVGSHSVRALCDAGHEVRLLVRSPERVRRALEPLGIGEVESVVGDATDEAGVERLLDGCDAVLHAASVYSYDPRQFARMRATNVRCTEVVLGTAARLGLDPIVHVSSFVALMPADGVLTPDTPTGRSRSPYPRSKAESEAVARRLQDQGVPVVVTHPGSVWGPSDPHAGESHQLARNLLTGRAPLLPRGGYPMVDVRDLAAAHAAVFEPGRGARRYLLGGTYVAMPELVALLGEATGRSIRAPQVPPGWLLPAARSADVLQRLLPFRLPLPTGGIWVAGQAVRTDDSRALAELGFSPRPLRETVRDTVRSLVEDGLLESSRAGALAG